jgi:hypothetical protein
MSSDSTPGPPPPLPLDSARTRRPRVQAPTSHHALTAAVVMPPSPKRDDVVATLVSLAYRTTAFDDTKAVGADATSDILLVGATLIGTGHVAAIRGKRPVIGVGQPHEGVPAKLADAWLHRVDRQTIASAVDRVLVQRYAARAQVATSMLASEDAAVPPMPPEAE